MGETFRYFINECVERFGKIIEANYYGGDYSIIKVETCNGKIMTVNIRLEDKQDA